MPAATAPTPPAARAAATTAPHPPPPGGGARGRLDQFRRLTYVMLLRVVVATTLLGASVVTEMSEGGPSVSPAGIALFSIIATTFALTLLWATLLRRRRAVDRLPVAQTVGDLVTVTAVVYLTGGAESGFVFLYLVLIVAASTMLSRRGTVALTAAVAVTYLAVALGGMTGLLPVFPGALPFELAARVVARTITTNLIAFVTTAALARRFAVELERAGADVAVHASRLEDLAVLHAAVVRSLTSGLLTSDTDGRIVSCNHAAEEILGTSAEAVAGKRVAEVLPGYPDDAARRAEGVRRHELRIAGADGAERVIGLSASPLASAAGKIVGSVVSFQDLTELERMRRTVERSERLAAIGRLATGVAHEIRNPLAAISGAVELLRGPRSAGASDDDQRELMDIVTREIERLDRLISELLHFAKPSRPERTTVELGAALRESAQVFARDPRIGSGRIVLEIDGPVWVSADPGQLKQVLWNLALNAAQAAPDETPIVLAAGRVDEGERRLGVITVRDRGPGVPLAHQGRVFEPFFSTKGGGTGLGLATVHRIVEEHHGRIEVDTPEDGGARFRVYLPREEPPAGGA